MNNKPLEFYWAFGDFEIKPTKNPTIYELVKWYETEYEIDYNVIGELKLSNAFLFDRTLLTNYTDEEYNILCDLLSDAQNILNKYVQRT